MVDPPPPKKKKKSKSRAERKKIRKGQITTVVKTGLKGFIKNNNSLLQDLLDECVWKTSLIACEASYLATYHINRLLHEDADIVLPKLDQTFFYQCITAIADIGQPPTPGVLPLEVRNPLLISTLRATLF
jgi:hypothetical protein